ncbi:polyphosphoinositide phosphatase-like isoform X1 [Dreissena polymorpha]|uniref:polyphosphoinositide phosphatase-like isoform X1 n=1 Tax=Dreissena polymorpha TaxID=45954 RepID=UPI002264FC00|nr:polyphosphoinositide phosphatase-like isoform X1 [Dreissena polymorpha]
MELPLISSIQRVQVYETKARYYIIGSNSTETTFRVLKIDRQEPKDLVIQDDKHVYNKVDIRKLLEMIASGNVKAGKQKHTGEGFMKYVSAYGIVGFVRFLEGYYMVLVTKRSIAAVIGGHVTYKIEDTVMQYIPNMPADKYMHPDEPRYVKMFQSVDLSSNFYFSYSYDLTHTLQYNMAPSVDPKFGEPKQTDKHKSNVYGVKVAPERNYVWNKYLIEPYQAHVHSDWILHIIYGFIAQSNMYIYGKSVYITLLARRSNQFAGPRFMKRGANSQGAVANEVETEQIVQDMCVTQLHKGRISSYVQMRGSIPLYWSQDISKMVPKPAITVDKRDPYFHTAGLHFNRLLYRYGAPVILLNLVKRREKRRHEGLLCDEYKDCKAYLNQFLPPDKQLIYIGFDMAHYTKKYAKHTNDVFDRLAGISRFCVKQTGFFLQLPQLRSGFWEQPEYDGVKGNKTESGCRQTGAVRTNCVDCIDRTNTAQFAVGKCALGYQLCALGVLPVPDLDFDTDCVTMLEELYENMGNTLALQYGGSLLVHRIEGYRKIAPWKAHSVDIFQTLSRYYSNAFSDLEKQQAMNVFLGVFVAHDNELNIWDLPTDFYLHNPDAAGLKMHRKSYTMWCDPAIFNHLPLPFEEACKPSHSLIQVLSREDEAVNVLFENYKPYTLTDIKRLAQDMEKVIRNYRHRIYRNPSPFERRASFDGKDSRFAALSIGGSSSHHHHHSGKFMLQSASQELGRTISVKDSTASTTSNTSKSSEDSSSSASSVEGDIVTSSCSDDEKSHFKHRVAKVSHPEPNVYDLDLAQYEEDEFTQELYKRYVDIGAADQSKLSEMKVPHLMASPKIEPLGEYPGDIYGVEEPEVSKRSMDVYIRYVQCGLGGASEPSAANKEIYRNYIRQLYM